MPEAIVVAGNGPSSQADRVCHFPWPHARTFRTNYFFLPVEDALGGWVTDWFLCEAPEDCRAAVAFLRGADCYSDNRTPAVSFWFPGIRPDICQELATNHLDGFPVRLQKAYPRLPAACRWETDLAPYRPLMGSFAIAVAVGMQPAELYLCGHDFFQHETGASHGGVAKDTRSWQQSFNAEYLEERHRNHRLSGDVRYIREALRAYRGHVVCVGSVMKKLYAEEFPAWEFLDG